MSLPQVNANHRRSAIKHTSAAAYSMTSRDRVLLVDSSAAAVVVTLPPVGTVADRHFTIRKVGTGTNKIEMVDPTAIDMTIIAAIDLDFTLDKVCLYSDGLVWNLLSQAADYGHS